MYVSSQSGAVCNLSMRCLVFLTCRVGIGCRSDVNEVSDDEVHVAYDKLTVVYVVRGGLSSCVV